MRRELAMEFSRVTEAAALASYKWIGRGQKELADDAAVSAMRHMLNTIDIDGEVVIGEGEIDDAPMLYLGEKVGLGGDAVDIAVDPIDGTRMVALGQENAVAVMVLADRGGLLCAPDMYMEKLMVPSIASGTIDLDLPIEVNIKNIAKAMNKEVCELTVMTLFKPRHEEFIKKMHLLDVRVVAIPDGDVAGSVDVAMPDSDVDIFYGIGGAPEGVISAAIMHAMDGDMQARLVTRSECKGSSIENDIATEVELAKCHELNINVNKKLVLTDLIKTDNLIISITGITEGNLLKGCRVNGNLGSTETLLIRGKTRTIRRINSTHFLDKKDDFISNLVKK